MKISVSHPIDRSYVTRAVKATMGWKYWLFRVGGPLIVAMSLVPVAELGDLVSVLFGVAAFFIPDFVVWITRRKSKGELEAKLRLTDEGVSEDFSGATTVLAWQDFRDARETRDFVMLRRPGGVSIAVPKARLSEQQHSQLRDVLKKNGLLR